MPVYLPIHQIRRMTYLELKRWWEVDFAALASTAVAEATGTVEPSVRKALASDEWVEQWCDALYAGCGELLSGVERMEHLGDGRLARTRIERDRMMKRLIQARRLLKEKTLREAWEVTPESQKDARAASVGILRKHHQDEFLDLRLEELARKGLPEENPLFGVSFKDAYHCIEESAKNGVLSVPVTPEVERLMSFDGPSMKAEVARDVNNSRTGRCDALRHPLLLRRWSEALHQLLAEHAELSGVEPQFSIYLPRLDIKALRRGPEEAGRKTVSRRRFLRALAQRNQECGMHRRRLVRAANMRLDEVRQPWRDAARTAQEDLAQRHPGEMTALLAAFAPYCKADSTRFREGALSTRGRGDLIHDLKKKLASGTLMD